MCLDNYASEITQKTIHFDFAILKLFFHFFSSSCLFIKYNFICKNKGGKGGEEGMIIIIIPCF